LEKLPFFVLAVVASYVTFMVQRQGGAVMSVVSLPLRARVGNALVSYCRYLGKLLWPTDLAVFYPHSGHWPLATVLLAGLLLVILSVLFFVKRRQCPFLLMGWLWYCGTLVPVIGLVQVGVQAMADRYAYIPSLGMLILAIWGANDLARHWRYRAIALSAVGLAAVVLCFGATRQQLGYWHDSETLLRHALAVTENNSVVHYYLGNALLDKSQINDAISEYQEAVRLAPGYAEARLHLGVALSEKGQLDEAISQFQEVIRLEPDDLDARYDLGLALYNKGQMDEAIHQYQEVIRLKPDDIEALNNLGIAFAAKRRFDEAIQNYRRAIEINPNYFGALNNLGTALTAKGQLDEAIESYRKAIGIDPAQPATYVFLGMALEKAGRTGEAIDAYQEALGLNPDLPGALNNLAWILATSPAARLRDGAEAVLRAEHACELTHYKVTVYVGTLAAAYAEAGRFTDAIRTAESAIASAQAAGQTNLLEKNRRLLELYRAGHPYHEGENPFGQ
jgi:tetratricopeptide (TPR) repeat protein